MKPYHPIVLSILVMSSFSCTSIEGETQTTAEIEERVPGGRVLETTTIQATVTGIDTPKRKIMLVSPKGKKLTTRVGSEVVNFDRIQIGDQLKVTLIEETVIRMVKPGERVEESAELVGELPAVGSKPCLTAHESYQVIATVTDIDPKKRKATLQFSDGTTKKVKVRSDIDLSQRKVGEKVLIRLTESLAVRLEKP